MASSSQSKRHYIFLEVKDSDITGTAEQVVGFLSTLKYDTILIWGRDNGWSVMLQFVSRLAFNDAKIYCEEKGRQEGLIKIKSLEHDFTGTTVTEIESTAPYCPGLSTKK
ncbi:uncharacterized protein LOC141594915 [Silene latifolia]|uniref:uncharacterized protein LOC141594915 n=1 Tax=Silene latifolia TaxID=37657 RepID=UPI003D76E04A